VRSRGAGIGLKFWVIVKQYDANAPTSKKQSAQKSYGAGPRDENVGFHRDALRGMGPDCRRLRGDGKWRMVGGSGFFQGGASRKLFTVICDLLITPK